MRIPRVYLSDISPDTNEVTISGQTGTHLIKVLRVKNGHPVTLFDGRGTEYQAVITEVKRHHITLQINSFKRVSRESPLSITLVQGISRGERMDWVLQKATELGVCHIMPIYTNRSMVSLDEKRLSSRMSHWQGVITHACEQCGRNTLPELYLPTSLPGILDKLSPSHCYYLEPDCDRHLNQIGKPEKLCLIIGPEGGFDKEERVLMGQHGITPLNMGPRILRTETAAIAALAAIGALWGDL
jgi:16S rRNA (uracil1498-N3)-methyltransferase